MRAQTLWFTKVGRELVKSQYPTKSVSELASMAATLWIELDKSEKSKWVQLAQQIPSSRPRPIYKRIKRPLNAYMMWLHSEGLSQITQEYPDFTPANRMSTAGRRWREMGVDEKAVWKEKSVSI